MKPTARKDQLLVEDLPSETFVYDAKSHKAHCLNRTVAFVWKNSNGTNTVADLASLLERELGSTVDEAVVLVALKQLRKASLLETDTGPDIAAVLPSRRELARKAAAVGGAAFFLPAISSASVPVPSSAGSYRHHGNGNANGNGNNANGNSNGNGNGHGHDSDNGGGLLGLLNSLFGGH